MKTLKRCLPLLGIAALLCVVFACGKTDPPAASAEPTVPPTEAQAEAEDEIFISLTAEPTPVPTPTPTPTSAPTPTPTPTPMPTPVPKYPTILEVQTDGAIVTVSANEQITAYCVTTKDVIPETDHPDWRPCTGFGCSFFKADGSYYIHVRDEAGEISDAVPFTVESGFLYVTEAEGLGHLMQPIEDFLAENNDSIDAFNKRIAKSATDAGLFTRAAVANVSMTLLSDMAGYRMTLSYEPRGDYTAEKEWGVSPGWGTRFSPAKQDSAGTYRNKGMDCGRIIIWAYKQAGLNINFSPGYGSIVHSGFHKQIDDNEIPLNAGDTADIIRTKTGHTMMILDRVDTDDDGLSDSYLVLEMESPYLKLKLRSLYSVRLCQLFDMSAVFDDTGYLRTQKKWWSGSFRIPTEAFPSYYDLSGTGK